MSLIGSINNALSGLKATQAQLAVISQNVANASTVGYTRKTLAQSNVVYDGKPGGVTTQIIQRSVDTLLRKDIRREQSTQSNYAAQNDYYTQIQNLFGNPNSDTGTIQSVLGQLDAAMASLANAPDEAANQRSVISAAQTVASTLNSSAKALLQMRMNADQDIATSVKTVNNDLANIQTLNMSITRARALGQSSADLEDQRDTALADLAQQMDIQSFERPNGEVVVMTKTGNTLLDGTLYPLSYTANSSMGPTTALSPITVNGVNITSQIKGGKIGGLLSMAGIGGTLDNLNTQLDNLAGTLFTQMQTTVNNDPNITITTPGLQNDTVYLFDFSNGGAGTTGTRALDIRVNQTTTYDYTGAPYTVHTVTGLDPNFGGSFAELARPTEGVPTTTPTGTPATPITAPYTPYTPANGQSETVASRIYNNMEVTSIPFAAVGGLPAQTTSITGYAALVISASSTQAKDVQSLSDTQDAYVTSLQQQASQVDGVSIDEELANLTVYQNAYSASARVMTTANSMFDTLLNISP